MAKCEITGSSVKEKFRNERRTMKMKRWLKGITGVVMSMAMIVALAVFLPQEVFAAKGDPYGIAYSDYVVCDDGTMLVADPAHNVIRKCNKKGKYSVFAGVDGKTGSADGKLKKALFNAPWGIAEYGNGYLVTDSENGALRYIEKKKVTTLKVKGYKFVRPTGIASDGQGNVYVSDTGNACVVMVDAKGKAKVVAGTKGKEGCTDGKKANKALLTEPTGVAYDGKTLYIADSGNHRIVSVEKDKLVTVAGAKKGIEDDKDGKALNARFSNPQGLCAYNGKLYIADTGNGSVKVYDGKKVKTIVPAFSQEYGFAPASPRGMVVKDGVLLVGDMFALLTIKVEL